MTERTNIVNETQDDATRIVYLPTDKLHTFAEHPYKIIDNDEMASLVESIKTQGVLTPIVVRPMENGEYEIVSGHRRVFACKKLGIFEVPAVVRELTREEAIVVMADSNLHRDGLLPKRRHLSQSFRHTLQRTTTPAPMRSSQALARCTLPTSVLRRTSTSTEKELRNLLRKR